MSERQNATSTDRCVDAALFDDLCEYFEQRSDVRDGSYGVPKANEEMSLLSRLNDCILWTHARAAGQAEPVGKVEEDDVHGFPNVTWFENARNLAGSYLYVEPNVAGQERSAEFTPAVDHHGAAPVPAAPQEAPSEAVNFKPPFDWQVSRNNEAVIVDAAGNTVPPDDVARLLNAGSGYVSLPCGHHVSLLCESLESDYKYCDLCECRKQRNDAEKMELHYRDKLRYAVPATKLLEAAASGMAIIISHVGAFESLTPYMRGKYEEFSAWHKLACERGAWPATPDIQHGSEK